jgi:hypothetical protein
MPVVNTGSSLKLNEALPSSELETTHSHQGRTRAKRGPRAYASTIVPRGSRVPYWGGEKRKPKWQGCFRKLGRRVSRGRMGYFFGEGELIFFGANLIDAHRIAADLTCHLGNL